MNFHSTQQLLKTILSPFESASLVVEDGKLLASADKHSLKSTTSRLVVLQIIKKYLNPQIGDLFILNDPENGGLNYQNIFFTTRLTDKLYLVFVKELAQINIKIPPTPLYDKGIKNKTVWPFLVDQNPHKIVMNDFFENQWNLVKEIRIFNSYLNDLSLPKNQQAYFKMVSILLERYFNNKALGQNEVSVKLSAENCIKLKLTVDEKQNQRSIHADFSQTSVASKICAASHIIESALVAAIAESYGMSHLLSQPVLDLIRLSLPPQSLVSKANALGTYNLHLQKTITEQISFLLNNLTGQTKKPKNTAAGFQLSPEFQLDLNIADKNYSIAADAKRILFNDLDFLLQSQQLVPLMIQNIDGKVCLKLKVETNETVSIKPRLLLPSLSQEFFTVSGAPIKRDSETIAKKNDVLELNWTITK